MRLPTVRLALGYCAFVPSATLLAATTPAPSAETATAGTSTTDPVSLEKLKERYAGLTRLQADVEQTRTGKHLLKAFVSEIRLDYQPGAITWRYLKPFEQTVKVTRQGIDLGERKLPPAHSERLRSLTSMLDSLFRMDLDAIRKDFDLKVDGPVVEASPRAGSPLRFVKAMRFEFDRKLDIVSVMVTTETDAAVMKFSNIKLEK